MGPSRAAGGPAGPPSRGRGSRVRDPGHIGTLGGLKMAPDEADNRVMAPFPGGVRLGHTSVIR